MYVSSIRASIAVSALVVAAGATGAFAMPAHADGPLGGGLSGLEQLQGAEFGDLSGVVAIAEAEAQPPASTIESPSIPAFNTAAVDAPAPASAPASANASATQQASVRLPSTGSGATAASTNRIPAFAALFALAGIACVAASRRTHDRPSTRPT